ncbi:MAG: hypothetical protein ACRYF3_03395, partial [Janthinobacterium lividum]
RLKELMVRRAERVYVLAHGAKIGLRPFHAWYRMPLPWTLVTDASAPAERVAGLRALGVEVVVVDGGSTRIDGDAPTLASGTPASVTTSAAG